LREAHAAKDGYASLDKRPPDGIAESDYELPHTTSRDAEFAILAGEYDKRQGPPAMAPAAAYAGIVDFESGRDGIRAILHTHFQALHGYSNSAILWDAAQNQLSMFLNDNAINNADGLWNFVRSVFNGAFVFSKPHIWRTNPPYPQNVRGLVINLARQHNGLVSRGQIDEFFARIKINAPINAAVLAQEEILSYERGRFILAETVNLDIERRTALVKALDSLFSDENVPYIVLRDITTAWLSRLPDLSGGIHWTPLLLQEVLRVHPDIGYRIPPPILKGQDLDTVRAAIVPCKSDISTFADLVHRFCYSKYTLPHRMDAEGLRLELRSAGFLEGNKLIGNMHKALNNYRFAFTEEHKTVLILER
jgi:hypothetical protein